MSLLKKTLSVILAAIMALSVFSVAVSAASDFTVDGEDPIATLTLDTDTLTVNPGDEIVVAAYLTTNFYAASYTIPFWFSKNLFSPVGAELNADSPYANYAKFAYNANLNTTLTKNQFGTKTLAWTANPVLAANGLTASDITKDNFQDYFYYATCGFTPNSQIGSQAEVMDNSPIVDYTFKVADDAAQGVDGEHAVSGGLSGLDAQDFRELIDDLLCTLDIAGGAQAAADDVFALGFQGEEGIESDYAVNLRHGNAGLFGNDLLNLQRNITIFVLDVAEDHHQGRLFICVSVTDFADGLHAGFADMSHTLPPVITSDVRVSRKIGSFRRRTCAEIRQIYSYYDHTICAK